MYHVYIVTCIMLKTKTNSKTELIRVDSKVISSLRQYCLDKHGKVYGMITEEASQAIKEHIKQNPVK